jgi:hypothetical protein
MKSAIYRSLEAAINHPSCVTAEWMHKFDQLNIRPFELSGLAYDDNTLTWVDENKRLFCLAFPAILNLKGEYTEIASYSDIVNNQSMDVCFSSSLKIQCVKRSL